MLRIANALFTATMIAWQATLVLAEPPRWQDAPVRPDGTRDFFTLLNREASEGVTNDNNAFVGFLLVTENDDWFEPHRAAVFEEMGLDRPGKDAPVFSRQTPGWDGLPEEKAQQAEQQWREAWSRPWSIDELPYAASWLRQNKRAMDLMREHLARERYYSPLVCEEEPRSLTVALLPHLGYQRSVARAYAASAFLKLHAQDLEGAWEEVMLLRRMAWHVSQEPIVISNLVGISINRLAANIAADIAAQPTITSQRLLQMKTEWDNAPRTRRAIEALIRGERITMFETILQARYGDKPPAIEGDDEGLLGHSFQRLAKNPNFDPNYALVRSDALYREFAQIGKTESAFSQLNPLLAAFDERIRADSVNARQFRVVGPDGEPLVVGSTAYQRKFTDLVVDLVAGALLASQASAIKVEYQINAYLDVVSVSLAVAAYRADHGDYPDALATLVPKYLDATPIDRFDGQPLRYRVLNDAVIIYSISSDLEDDGGDDQPVSGDLAVRLPK